MKLKQLADDFSVEELTDVKPAAVGDFALYRLRKRGWTTPAAVEAIRHRWQVDPRYVSFGGLKDRHANTVQYLTIWRGPQQRLTHHGFRLEYLGRLQEPYTSRDFRGNRFQLVVRALSEGDIGRASVALAEVQQCGVPNYFDDQRFSSVNARETASGARGEFVAKALAQGEFEKALRLALAAPYAHDRTVHKNEKAILQRHWGSWQACAAKLPPGHARDLTNYLAGRPGDFRGAIARLRPELRGLYMSAYQSHLWNRMLERWLRDHLPSQSPAYAGRLANQLVDVALHMGPVPMHTQPDPRLAALELPLPTARGSIDPNDPRAKLMKAILDEEGLTREQLKVKGLREVFFSRGERAALCMPAALQHETCTDERNHGRMKMIMEFELPRGSYATLLVKRAFNLLAKRQTEAAVNSAAVSFSV